MLYPDLKLGFPIFIVPAGETTKSELDLIQQLVSRDFQATIESTTKEICQTKKFQLPNILSIQLIPCSDLVVSTL